MKRYVAVVLCCGALALAQGPGRGGMRMGGAPMGGAPMGGGPGGPGMGGGPGMMMTRTPVTGAPFSGVQTTVSQERFADGNVITRQDTSKVYRDGQGRVRVERTATPPGAQAAQTMIHIFDPVANNSYMLNPSDQTAHKMGLPARRPAGGEPPAPPADPNATVKTEDLGTQNVNGVPATGTRITSTIAAGAIGNAQPIVITRETWVATNLKVPVQIRSTDPRFGTTTMNMTNIVTAEPEATLFQVPASYTVSDRGRMGGGAMMRRGAQPQHRQQQ